MRPVFASYRRPLRDSTYAKEADAADDGSVVGGGQGIVCGSDDALGSAASGGLLNVDLLGRHCDCGCDATRPFDTMKCCRLG